MDTMREINGTATVALTGGRRITGEALR
jgi:hypothetical protein